MTLRHDHDFFELDRPAKMAVSYYESPEEFWLYSCSETVTETLEGINKKLNKYGGKYKVSEGIRVSSFDLFIHSKKKNLLKIGYLRGISREMGSRQV